MNEEPSPQEALNIIASELKAIHKEVTTMANRLGIIVLPFWIWLIGMVLGILIGTLYLLAELFLR